MKDLRFCKDCKHYRGYKQCGHPKTYGPAQSYDLVLGEASDDHHDAWSQRYDGWLGCRLGKQCGAEGRWWEARP